MIDKRTLPKPYKKYEEIKDGFQVLNDDGMNVIDFEKASVFTTPVLRVIIEERYKNGIILKACQTCKKFCKQIKVKGVKFKCYQREKK